MASVKLILRQDKINKNTGLAPLYLRVIKNRKAKFVSLKIRIKPEQWNVSFHTKVLPYLDNCNLLIKRLLQNCVRYYVKNQILFDAFAFFS